MSELWVQVLLGIVAICAIGISIKMVIGSKNRSKSLSKSSNQTIQQTGNTVGGDMAGRDIKK